MVRRILKPSSVNTQENLYEVLYELQLHSTTPVPLSAPLISWKERVEEYNKSLIKGSLSNEEENAMETSTHLIFT